MDRLLAEGLPHLAAGLRALQARDRALESWLRTDVAAAYYALKADPGQALSLDQVRQHLRNKRKRSPSA